MHFVYLMRSIKAAKESYVGYTTSLEQELAIHNSGCATDTNKYRPWKIIMHFAFADESKAREFVEYLKSPTGKAFAQKRLWQ